MTLELSQISHLLTVAFGSPKNSVLFLRLGWQESPGQRWDAKLTHYQPSVADRLTIENIRANTDVPFDWLLYTYHIVDMSDAQIEAWVDNTVKAGITTIRTQFGKYAWSTGKMDRILAFYKAFEKYRVE